MKWFDGLEDMEYKIESIYTYRRFSVFIEYKCYRNVKCPIKIVFNRKTILIHFRF